jgi:hypothetical protein
MGIHGAQRQDSPDRYHADTVCQPAQWPADGYYFADVI